MLMVFLQKVVDKTKPGATIIPIILSSDKTQLTVFGNKMAYPVCLTIGNIPKAFAINLLTIAICLLHICQLLSWIILQIKPPDIAL
jgi:hypothetical protein